MSKRVAGIILIFLCLFGSALTFYGLNLLFSDVANMLMSSITVDIISSFPAFIFALDFMLGSIYVLRYVHRPQYKKRMTLLYSIILGVFSIGGIVTTVLSGTIVYPSLFAPYPFRGYLLICLIAHIFILIFSGASYFLAYTHMKEDPEKRKPTVHYVLYTIFLAIFVCFAYYRLGACLLGPLYIQWRTLYLTWPFYTAMLMPIALLVHTVLYSFEVYTAHPKGGIIHSSIVLASSIGLSTAFILIGMKNTQMISAISPVLPLERLAALPIDTIAYVLLIIGYGIYELIYSIRYYLRHRNKNNKELQRKSR